MLMLNDSVALREMDLKLQFKIAKISLLGTSRARDPAFVGLNVMLA